MEMLVSFRRTYSPIKNVARRPSSTTYELSARAEHVADTAQAKPRLIIGDTSSVRKSLLSMTEVSTYDETRQFGGIGTDHGRVQAGSKAPSPRGGEPERRATAGAWPSDRSVREVLSGPVSMSEFPAAKLAQSPCLRGRCLLRRFFERRR